MQHSNLRKTKIARASILLGGLIATQFVLYGPSLLGWKILLPLETLTYKRLYLPDTLEWEQVQSRHPAFSDEVLSIEFRRRFAASEVRAGRVPLWNPYNYCGAPFLAANNTAVFSPFSVPNYFFPGTTTIAWVQLLKALVSGVGAYLFFRVVLRVRYWPATFGAWFYPLTWFFILWRGYPPSFVVAWLPWLILAIDRAVRKPSGWGGISVALLTAAIMVSGQAASAAHVLLASGMYFAWCVIDEYGLRGLIRSGPLCSTLAVICGWFLGFVISAPQNLPTYEYLQWSNRVAARAAGEAPQITLGPEAWPQLVLPYFHGAELNESDYLIKFNAAEGAPAGYAGLIVALVLAPLAFISRRHRGMMVFWVIAGLLSVSFIFSIPVLKSFYSPPPLGLLKNNRFIFLAAWSVTVMAAIGMDVLCRRQFQPRWWFIFPLTLAICLFFLCLHHAYDFPHSLRVVLGVLDNSPEVRQWFRQMYLASAAFCLLPILIWTGLSLWPRSWWRRGIAALALTELIVMAYGVNPQCDPSLYYPRIEPLAELSERIQEEPGRVCGYSCLPPNMNQRYGLSDIRGYDGTDPKHLVALLALVERHLPEDQIYKLDYAVTQYFQPINSPLLDMLNLRYRIFRGEPPEDIEALFSGDDYWVLESDRYLPRVYIPSAVESVDRPEKALQKVAEDTFDPRQVAYVYSDEESFSLADIQGQATIVSETPLEIEVDVDMDTPGVVVLADLFMPGWKAYLNDEQLDIYLTNLALRGVRVPAGQGRLTFRYEPQSFVNGLRWMSIGVIAIAIWGVAVIWIARRAT